MPGKDELQEVSGETVDLAVDAFISKCKCWNRLSVYVCVCVHECVCVFPHLVMWQTN